MNRRTKDRVDLRLQCRLGPQKVLSVASAGQSQIIGLTQNVSRCGLLMRWLEDVELPAPGSDLTVDIDLPADASFGPRLMRCRATVVRIIRNAEGLLAVGMKIRNIRFVAPTPSSKKRAAAAVAGGTPTQWELESIRGPPKGSINPMLMPTASSERAVKSAVVVSAQEQAREKIPFIARFLPSLTDLAFLMPLIFLFLKLDGARTLLGDGDTGSHVRTGEWIMAHGAVPDNDIFSFSRPGAPWFAWEWLWDVLVAVLHQRWGMSAVVAASALLFRLIRRYCGNGLVAIAVTLLATGGCAIHWLARPHLFSLLFLTVTLHITMRGAEGRTRLLAWLVPLTLLWTNLHGGFFIIFLVLLCYIANGLVNAAIEKDPHARRVWLAGLRPWLVTFAACFAVTFINPYGWQLHKHVVEYIIDPYSLNHITEFQSMNFHAPVSVYFEPLMILTIVVALSDARNRRFAEVFLALGWLHLALIAQRNLPLYTIAAAPIAARGISAAIAYACDSSGSLAGWIGRTFRWFRSSSASVEETDRIPRVHLVSAIPYLLVDAHPAFDAAGARGYRAQPAGALHIDLRSAVLSRESAGSAAHSGNPPHLRRRRVGRLPDLPPVSEQEGVCRRAQRFLRRRLRGTLPRHHECPAWLAEDARQVFDRHHRHRAEVRADANAQDFPGLACRFRRRHRSRLPPQCPWPEFPRPQ